LYAVCKFSCEQNIGQLAVAVGKEPVERLLHEKITNVNVTRLVL
jgi:hypothetical protein